MMGGNSEAGTAYPSVVPLVANGIINVSLVIRNTRSFPPSLLWPKEKGQKDKQ
jgi:hypothetical protein